MSFTRLRQFVAERLVGKRRNKISRPAPSRLPFFEALEDRHLPAAGPREQYMLELINRMRANPAAELPLLLNSGDPNVLSSLNFFNVNQTLLAQQWAALTPGPPLAWNDAIASASVAHSLLMAQLDIQDHVLPGEADLGVRFTAAGYTGWNFIAENIFAYSQSIFHAHAALAIDWGFDAGGIQTGAGHRTNLMSQGVREMGIGIVDGLPGKQTGPLVITQDFGNRFNFGNPFLLGVAFKDINADTFYTQGEGLAGVNVAINGTGGNFVTTTGPGGGYQLQVPSGAYTVTFSGGTLLGPVVKNVVVSTANAKVDARVGDQGTLAFTETAKDVAEGGGSVTLTVSRTGDASSTVSVQFATGAGTAAPGTDYTATAGTLTFAPGESSKTITVTILNDNSAEGTETIPLALSNPTGGAALGQSTATIRIIDDESAGFVQFESLLFRVPEFMGTATVTATRTDGLLGGVTVLYATSDGTAKAGVDYTATSGQVTFGAGQTSKIFTINFNPDLVLLGKKTVNLTLDNPTGASLGSPATAVVAILDDEGSASQRYVATVFLDVLKRPVDPSGLAYWSGRLDQGLPRGVLVDAIDHGDEYFGNIIRPAYNKFLGREADASGLQYWIGQMRQGLTDEQLEAGFIGAPEYYQFTGNTNVLWIRAMYQNLLGRQPDQGGENFWLSRLGQGASRASIALGFAASPEREAIGVRDLYARYLGRLASDTEVAYWVSQFTTGVTNEQIVTGFAGSIEYFQSNVV